MIRVGWGGVEGSMWNPLGWQSRPSICEELMGQDMGEMGENRCGGHAAASLQLVIRVNDCKSATTVITLGLGNTFGSVVTLNCC